MNEQPTTTSEAKSIGPFELYNLITWIIGATEEPTLACYVHIPDDVSLKYFICQHIGRLSILKYASTNLCTSGVWTCGVHLEERTPGGREDARTGGRSFAEIGTRAYLMTSSYLPVPAF